MEPGPGQRGRTDFARQIFGKLGVGGFDRRWRLFPIPLDSRAGNFDNHHEGTVGSTPRRVMRRSSYLNININGRHSA